MLHYCKTAEEDKALRELELKEYEKAKKSK